MEIAIIRQLLNLFQQNKKYPEFFDLFYDEIKENFYLNHNDITKNIKEIENIINTEIDNKKYLDKIINLSINTYSMINNKININELKKSYKTLLNLLIPSFDSRVS